MAILWAILLFASFVSVAHTANDGLPVLNLTEEILYKSYVAANLSSLVYEMSDRWISNITDSGFFHPDYDSITFFTNGPDQAAIVAKKDGICYLAFRGTDLNFNDWAQNIIDMGDIDIYRDYNITNSTSDSCKARKGFTDFILSPTASEGLDKLENCLAECEEEEDCLVITGHSQGGASATIAAILLHRYDPTVITFGQPPTIDPGCPWINSEKFYRYVNSQESGSNSITFDLVVFGAPILDSGSEYYGYFILLGESMGAVKYLGFDSNYTFSVSPEDQSIFAHTMAGVPHSYQDRISNLVKNFPISTDGFEGGHICKDEYTEVCASGSCVEEQCIPLGGLTELCVFSSCGVDSDCAGDYVCIYDSCAAGPGMAEDGCACRNDSDCKNNECVTVNSSTMDTRCAVTEPPESTPRPPTPINPQPTRPPAQIETTSEGWPVLDLTSEILHKSYVAVNLSSIAYDPSYLWASNDTASGFFHPDYDNITFYTDEPDQAIVARRDGICYLAFRGTNANLDDWAQNANLGDIDIFKDNLNSTGLSCEARAGFADFILSPTAVRGVIDLESCIADCEEDDCLVITGHSQGGAGATIAAVLLHRHNPTVITFGQPPTMDPGCAWINSHKFYRYVNSLQDGTNSMGFDLVVFAPNWVSGSGHYGYFILLGEALNAVKYLGFNSDYDFSVHPEDNNADAHSIYGEPFSYRERIANLVKNFPISTDGFEVGHICEAEYSDICLSGSCVEERCIPVGGITELCVYDSCEVDSDCAGDYVCIYDSCAAGPGMVENGCSCATDADCKNRDCVTVDVFSLDFRCSKSSSSVVFPYCFGSLFFIVFGIISLWVML